jgi:hypothetical protein
MTAAACSAPDHPQRHATDMIRTMRDSPRIACVAVVSTVIVINFTTMPGANYGGDPDAMREEARNIVLHGGLAADPGLAREMGEPGQFFAENISNSLYYSKYGIANSLMYVPPMLAERVLTGELPVRTERTRLLILNVYNIALSALIAVLLFRITGLYARDPLARTAFVLASFYGTFLWNYLRAQSSEIFQVLFFLGFYLSFIRVLRSVSPPGGQAAPPLPLGALILSWVFIAALALTRVTYVLLSAAPWLAIGYGLVNGGQAVSRPGRTIVVGLLAPTACVVATMGGVNWVKFGSPLLAGYHQWGGDCHAMTGDLIVATYGFLFSVQKSVFIHFPVLALALFGCGEFRRKYPGDAVLLAGVFLAFFVVIGKFPIWRGDWCYGPRYLLFMLPAVSLPFVFALERWLTHPLRAGSQAGLLTSALIIAASVGSQIEVNRLPFHTYFVILRPLESDASLVVSDYFLNNHFARINADLALVNFDPDRLVYVREFRKKFDRKAFGSYLAFLERTSRTSNYYWTDYRFARSLWRRISSFSWL